MVRSVFVSSLKDGIEVKVIGFEPWAADIFQGECSPAGVAGCGVVLGVMVRCGAKPGVEAV